ncbi:hypothetical protein CMI37_27485 [Candidatus Pacearchaeota archaeon]|nr:hypothetical protein [Candidatus Pacearchaeota archaeon]
MYVKHCLPRESSTAAACWRISHQTPRAWSEMPVWAGHPEQQAQEPAGQEQAVGVRVESSVCSCT